MAQRKPPPDYKRNAAITTKKMTTHKVTQIITQTTVALLILLWTYTAIGKWADSADFRLSLSRQPLPRPELLFWTLPLAELLAAGLLVSEKTRKWGLYLSSLLLFAFTVYIAAGLMGLLEKVPCSCGGVLRSLGWKEHLLFNLVFLALSLYSSYNLRSNIQT